MLDNNNMSGQPQITPKRSALGRGLSSLIPVSELKREFIEKIQISKIVSNKFQPRHNFVEEKLQELVESIKEHGVIQPIIVRKAREGYELIAGERRFLAAQRIGLDEVPAIVKNVSDQESLELALIENIQRDDLNPIEEALGYDMLCKEFNLTQDSVAQKVGRSRTSVTNAMRLLKLPEQIQGSVAEGSFSVGHAKVILGIDDTDTQLKVFNKIVSKDLTVRETEKIVHSLSLPKTTKSSKIDLERNRKYKNCAEHLRNLLDSSVEIKWSGEKGKLVIHFESEKDLEDIVRKIASQSASENL